MERLLRKRKHINYKEGVCRCTELNGQKCAFASGCLNRTLNIFCTDENCGLGGQCKNRRKAASKPFSIKMTEERGKGIFASEHIEEGTYILECKGKMISGNEFIKHCRTMKGAMVCSFCIEPGIYLDMCRGNDASNRAVVVFHRAVLLNCHDIQIHCLYSSPYTDPCPVPLSGTVDRYLNHSCDPNAAVHKIMEGSNCVMTIVALHPIEKDEEITISYDRKPKGFVCRCKVCCKDGDT